MSPDPLVLSQTAWTLFSLKRWSFLLAPWPALKQTPVDFLNCPKAEPTMSRAYAQTDSPAQTWIFFTRRTIQRLQSGWGQTNSQKVEETWKLQLKKMGRWSSLGLSGFHFILQMSKTKTQGFLNNLPKVKELKESGLQALSEFVFHTLNYLVLRECQKIFWISFFSW